MGDDHACEPDWREAKTYLPLLGADPTVWAWEFARRGLERSVVGGVSEAAAGRAPELCFVGDGPPGDRLPAVLWRWQADCSAPVFSVAPARAGDRAALDLARLDLASLVVRTDDGDQHVLISDGLRRLRLAVVEGDILAGPAGFCFHLPAPDTGRGALEGLRQLMVLRDTGRLASTPVHPPPKALRWLQVLRAHDARRAGASQRDIAVSLFGEARVRDDWTAGSDYMRMRVQRLVRAAEQMAAGGYRALFGLRDTGLAPPRMVEIWRSPRWLAGLAPTVLSLAVFLGTSFSSPGFLHDARQDWGAARHKSVERSRIMASAGPASTKSPVERGSRRRLDSRLQA